MKKIALFLAVMMLLAVSMTAMANPSISELTAELVSAEAVIENADGTESSLPEGFTVGVTAANPDNYAYPDVREAVKAVNGNDVRVTVADIIDADSAFDATGYDFVTAFSDIALSDGTNIYFDIDGQPVKVKVTLKFDALAGETDLSSYKLLLINPSTGEFVCLDLDPEAFNSETGEITIELPFLGVFALIQK